MANNPGGGVVFRPEIASLPVYRQGKPPKPGGIKLSSNELPFPPLPEVVEVLSTGQWNRYPDATASTLRQKLSDLLGFPTEWFLVGAGSVALLQQFIQAAAGPGDEVMYSWRSFEAYPGLVTVSGAASVKVPNRSDHGHDIDAMIAAITPRTRVVMVCSPNNPTSTVVTTDEFERLMAAVPSTCLVILDEAYREFVDHAEAVRGEEHVEKYPNLVLTRTFSKAYGLAGLRVGYAIGRPELLAPAQSAGIPLAVSAPAQLAAEVSLEQMPEINRRVAEISERVSRVREELTQWGGTIPLPYGNFVWIPAGEHTETVSQWLEDEGIVARAFAGEGIRVSIAEAEAVDALLRILKRVVDDLPKSASQARLG
jgi:histidinol-phosphate aminotransferase